jgi:hypothetical protein
MQGDKAKNVSQIIGQGIVKNYQIFQKEGRSERDSVEDGEGANRGNKSRFCAYYIN